MTKRFYLSVKALVRDDAGHYLFLRRSPSSKNNAGKWDMPGGKVDPGETFDTALVREIREETGLVIKLERPAGVAQSDLPDRAVTYLIMEARVTEGSVCLSTEHVEHRWVALADLPSVDLCPQFIAFVRTFATSSGQTRAD
jgi:8-oxo-dGTP diphosphatase